MALAQATRLPAQGQTRLHGYVGIWFLAAVLGISVLGASFGSSGAIKIGAVAALLVLTAATESVVLYLHHGKSREFVSLVEAAIVMAVLLLPPDQAIATTVGGVLVANLVHRRPFPKILFNVSQYAVGTVAAIFLFHQLGGPGDDPSVRAVGALLVAMAGFGLVNATAISGIVSLLEGRSFLEVLADGAQISSLTVLGNTCVGALAAVMWGPHPELTPLFIAPALILHLAYRGVVRTHELLGEVTSERDRLNRIIVGASDGIALLDAEGRVDVWNPAMEALTGVKAIDAIGNPITSALQGTTPDGSRVDAAEPLRNANPAKPTSIVEMTVSHSTGGTKIAKIRHTALFNAHGVLSGDAIVVDDVTRERENERLKDDFLARVSHELRTPLTPIKGYAQTMLRRRSKMTEEKQEEVLSLIVERSEHMETMINDLLVVSQAEVTVQGIRKQLKMAPVDLQALCRQVIDTHAARGHEHVLQLNEGAEVITAVADVDRLTQIVDALVSNAFKFSEAGTLVELAVSRHDGRATITVTDHGRGIPADHLDRIFQRFHRVEDPMIMETGGMGLGLFIARSLARAMGGQIAVRSRVSEGSSFTLELDLATDAEPDPVVG